jgi:FtsH-binding integral membrane protein
MSNQFNNQPAYTAYPQNDDKPYPIGFKGSQQPPPYGYGINPTTSQDQQFPPNTNPNPYVGDGFTDFSFSDALIRRAFIRKVYCILTLQLAITVGFIALFLFCEPVKFWFKQNSWFSWVLIAGTLVVVIVLACCDGVRRQHPLNLILLFGFTIMESILLGCVSATYDTNTVLIAAGITTLVVVGITIFSFQTKIDFTGMGIYLFVFVLVLFGFGLIAAIMRSQILNIVYASLGAGIFSLYLVFDTQLMLGGKHKYSISPEEYVMAALNLYLDIINLFLMILRLVGSAKN